LGFNGEIFKKINVGVTERERERVRKVVGQNEPM